MTKDAPDWFLDWVVLLIQYSVGVTATMFWVALVHEHFGFLAPIGLQTAIWMYSLPAAVINISIEVRPGTRRA